MALRWDSQIMVKSDGDGLILETFENAYISGSSEILTIENNINDIYAISLTTGENIMCSIDQVVLTDKGDKTVFELLGSSAMKTRKSHVLIGPNGKKPRTKEIYKLDKSAVFEIYLNRPLYFEVSGVLLKGKVVEGKKEGEKRV
jgi:hypothetical protein